MVLKFFFGSNWNFIVTPGLTISDTSVFCRNHRPKTGEETRLLLMNGIIMGAKGFFYDRDGNQKLLYPFLGFGNGEAIDSSRSIYFDNDIIGSDFIKLNNDSNLFHKYINFGTVASHIDVTNQRLYIGKKSTRNEIAKIHNWIRTNDSTLMRLNLATWLSKGFRLWYNQDTTKFGQDIILKKFISLSPDSLFTKRLWNAQTNNWQTQKESWDSSFFDITLLRDSSDHDLSSSTFYVGIQNRRTDPLIHHIYNN